MDNGKPSKSAIEMVAKDGELMAIYGSCDCSGKVFAYNKIHLNLTMNKTS